MDRGEDGREVKSDLWSFKNGLTFSEGVLIMGIPGEERQNGDERTADL